MTYHQPAGGAADSYYVIGPIGYGLIGIGGALVVWGIWKRSFLRIVIGAVLVVAGLMSHGRY